MPAAVLYDVRPESWRWYGNFVAEKDRRGPLPMTLPVVPDYHGEGTLDRHCLLVDTSQHSLDREDERVLHGDYPNGVGSPRRPFVAPARPPAGGALPVTRSGSPGLNA